MYVRPVMHGRSRSACACACCHVHAGARLAICFFAWRSMLRRAARAVHVLEAPPGPDSPGSWLLAPGSWQRHSAGTSHCAAQAPTAGCEIRAISNRRFCGVQQHPGGPSGRCSSTTLRKVVEEHLPLGPPGCCWTPQNRRFDIARISQPAVGAWAAQWLVPAEWRCQEPGARSQEPGESGPGGASSTCTALAARLSMLRHAKKHIASRAPACT